VRAIHRESLTDLRLPEVAVRDGTNLTVLIAMGVMMLREIFMNLHMALST
jgi:hypothetical protein